VRGGKKEREEKERERERERERGGERDVAQTASLRPFSRMIIAFLLSPYILQTVSSGMLVMRLVVAWVANAGTQTDALPA